MGSTTSKYTDVSQCNTELTTVKGNYTSAATAASFGWICSCSCSSSCCILMIIIIVLGVKCSDT